MKSKAYHELDEPAVCEVKERVVGTPLSQPSFELNGSMQNDVIDRVRIYRERVRIEQPYIQEW